MGAPVTDLSRFPHVCPRCKGPAYVGLSVVDCFNECNGECDGK